MAAFGAAWKPTFLTSEPETEVLHQGPHLPDIGTVWDQRPGGKVPEGKNVLAEMV
jgi:hypothetical protein